MFGYMGTWKAQTKALKSLKNENEFNVSSLFYGGLIFFIKIYMTQIYFIPPLRNSLCSDSGCNKVKPEWQDTRFFVTLRMTINQNDGCYWGLGTEFVFLILSINSYSLTLFTQSFERIYNSGLSHVISGTSTSITLLLSKANVILNI